MRTLEVLDDLKRDDVMNYEYSMAFCLAIVRLNSARNICPHLINYSLFCKQQLLHS